MVRQLFEDLKDDLAKSFENGKKELTNLNDKIQDKLDNLIDFDPNSFIILPEIRQDGCNTIIRVNSGFPGTNLQFVYRDPSCTLPKPPPSPPTPPGFVEVPIGENCYASFAFTIRTTVNVVRSISGGTTYYNKGALPPNWAFCGEFEVPVPADFPYIRCAGFQYDTAKDDEDFCTDELNGYVDYVLTVSYSNEDLVGGKLKIPSPNIKNYTYFKFPQTLSKPGQFRERIIEISSIPWELFSAGCEKEVPPPSPPPSHPPPPPPPPMSCCPNVKENDQLLRLILKRIGEPKEVIIFDEDLNRKGAQKAKKKPESLNDFLKLAVERTEIVSRIVGIENFPITVPDTMIEPHKEGAFAKIFGFIDGEKKRKIKTIAEFIAWMSEQDSAVLGEFHQVIEFETGEKDKKGKATTSTVVLPNVAEALREITLLVAQIAKQNNVQTEVLFKSLFEIVATRGEASKGTAIVQDIQDYLDYPTETKSAEYGSSVSIPKVQMNKEGKVIATGTTEDHKNLLKPGKVKFVYEDWTGDASLHDQMIDLLQLAAMMRAVYYQRTDK